MLSNYSLTRLSVRIIGAIKRQFFHMVTHVFDNSNLSQEIFAIDTWKAVICSLGHGRKHMLTILPTIWTPGFTFKVKDDSLLIQEFAYLLSIGLCSVTFNMTGYSHSYHSIKLIHCGASQRDVMSDKMVF